MAEMMTQAAPYPAELEDLVARCRYKTSEGWQYRLVHRDRGQGSTGLTLVITRVGPDAYHPQKIIGVDHYMIVPAASYNRRSWQRWLLEQIRLVESHETCENFAIEMDDGTLYRPYAPLHGYGEDPYMITELATEVERSTNFRNEVKAG